MAAIGHDVTEETVEESNGDSPMFADKEFIKIFPVDETITFDGLNSGDKIAIDIETVGVF